MDTTTGFTSVNLHPNSSNSSDTAVVIEIPKGTCLAEWTPYLITPLYRDLNDRDDGVFQGPTCFSGWSSLPRWNDCSIWRPQQQQKSMLWKSTKLQRFLKHARHKFLPVTTTTAAATRTISGDSLSIWNLLCLLNTLQVLDTSIMQQQQGDGDSENDKIASTIQSPTHDHNHEPMDDLDDDDLVMLMELWPLILQHIDWKTICSL
jgi:hypothetical protein